MDNFVDQFFSSSSWIEDNAPDGSSWVGGGFNQTNGVLDDAIEAYEGDGKNLQPSLIASSDIVDTLITDDASMFVGGDPSFGFNNSLITTESQPLEGGFDHKSSLSLLGLMDVNLMPNYGNQQPELFHVDLDPNNSPSVQPESGSVGSNESEPSEVQHTLKNPHCLPSLPPTWNPSTYSAVSSMPLVTVQDRQESLGLLGQYVDANVAFLGNNSFMDGDILQDPHPALLSEQHELNNQYLSSFSDGRQIPLGGRADIHPQMQLSEGNSSTYYKDQFPISQLPPAPVTSVGDCNGTVKPRVRARRGQATDPHSIAERLRREKIADRMKNLQELVPNSNKTDKASMLDEIIDYVKLLQLQVKALSMSKLGAAEAVVPFITHGHATGSSSFLLPSPAGRGVGPFDSSNDTAFEEEVVKLMESDMATAIQFLETKGLSLMPLALASAITSTKASSSSTSGEGVKSNMTNGVVHLNSNKPNTGTSKISSDGETSSKENNKIGINGKGRIPNHYNGKIIKQEEIFNTEEA